MKKKIIFFALLDKKYFKGYQKKINSFCLALSKKNLNVKQRIYTNNSLLGVLFFQIKLIFSQSDIIIIRALGERSFFLIPSLFILKLIKRKVILEIPSPLSKLKYEKEKKNIKSIIYLLFNNFFLNLLFVLSYKVMIYDYEIFTYSKNNKKLILTSNSVLVDNYKYLKIKNEINNNLNLIFIGYLSKWHGIDKIINSINEYIKTENKINIKLHIYGDVNLDYKNNLIKMINKYNLQDNIYFKKAEYNYENLYNLFKKCHLGIGSLSLELANSYYRSELKIREYCASGLPFIYNARDLDFPINFKYAYNIRSKKIDLKKIINWYNELPQDIPITLNKYAKSKIDYNVKIDNLLTKLEL